MEIEEALAGERLTNWTNGIRWPYPRDNELFTADLRLLLGRLARAEELLRPFAEAAPTFIRWEEDGWVAGIVHVRDLRAAAAFLNAPPIKPEA